MYIFTLVYIYVCICILVILEPGGNLIKSAIHSDYEESGAKSGWANID